MSVALVTGFPRLLARSIAVELLRAEGARVVMLVRPRFVDEARRWADGLGASGARVEVLEGDVTSIDMGLAGSEFMELSRRIEAVHHAAYSTSHEVPTPALTALNVQGTREILELARAGLAQGKAPRVVAYTSVLSLGDAEGVLREEDLELGQRFRTPVEDTMHTAEKILRHAMDTLPVTVVRPATLVGDSLTGEMDLFDGPYLFIVLMLSSPVDIRLPLPTHGDLPLQVVPLDHVARAGVCFARDPRAVGRTFHVVDPSPPTMAQALPR